MNEFFLLDTDTLTLWQNGHEMLKANRAEHELDLVAVSIITVEEALGGWYNVPTVRRKIPKLLQGSISA